MPAEYKTIREAHFQCLVTSAAMLYRLHDRDALRDRDPDMAVLNIHAFVLIYPDWREMVAIAREATHGSALMNAIIDDLELTMAEMEQTDVH